MSKFANSLNNLKVASPCSQDWDQMLGDDRRRYCGECKLNVYNLSGMTRAEAENLVMSAEGRLCVRFYQRADGSVLTQDCPVGWARVKQRTKAYVTAVASLIFTFFGALGLVAAFKKNTPTTMGEMVPVSTPERKMGKVAVNKNSNVKVAEKPVYVMGNFSPPKPKQTPVSEAVVGQIPLPNSDQKK